MVEITFLLSENIEFESVNFFQFKNNTVLNLFYKEKLLENNRSSCNLLYISHDIILFKF